VSELEVRAPAANVRAPGAPRAARVLAFYLPQFHPTAENDTWWGPGFTEWRNVARARPLFPGHVQPNLPGDLGFYDLRLPEAREAQAELARQYGIEAFCYWHYWFAGRTVLDRPFREVLASGRPDLPFCLAWANQTWSGTWHGSPDLTLLEQTYPGPEDDRRHFAHLLAAFRDPRYLRVEGRPLFYVFRPELLPEPAAFVERWQSLARAAGLDALYLVAESSDLLGRGPTYTSAAQHGFDAAVYVRLPVRVTAWRTARMRAARKLLRWPEHYRYADELAEPPPALGKGTTFPCVYPNWDNTPRSGRAGLVVTRPSPELFRTHLEAAVERVAARPVEQRLVFVKSWNEWAEGNYLEPDLEHGHGFLRAVAEAVAQR
jgi:lipopolysaccharide biosynthesis protein